MKDDKFLTLIQDVAILKEKVEEIATNHIPHLERKMDSLSFRVAYFSGGIAILIVVAEIVTKLWK